jgi:hypothetical protein
MPDDNPWFIENVESGSEEEIFNKGRDRLLLGVIRDEDNIRKRLIINLTTLSDDHDNIENIIPFIDFYHQSETGQILPDDRFNEAAMFDNDESGLFHISAVMAGSPEDQEKIYRIMVRTIVHAIGLAGPEKLKDLLDKWLEINTEFQDIGRGSKFAPIQMYIEHDEKRDRKMLGNEFKTDGNLYEENKDKFQELWIGRIKQLNTLVKENRPLEAEHHRWLQFLGESVIDMRKLLDSTKAAVEVGVQNALPNELAKKGEARDTFDLFDTASEDIEKMELNDWKEWVNNARKQMKKEGVNIDDLTLLVRGRMRSRQDSDINWRRTYITASKQLLLEARDKKSVPNEELNKINPLLTKNDKKRYFDSIKAAAGRELELEIYRLMFGEDEPQGEYTMQGRDDTTTDDREWKAWLSKLIPLLDKNIQLFIESEIDLYVSRYNYFDITEIQQSEWERMFELQKLEYRKKVFDLFHFNV